MYRTMALMTRRMHAAVVLRLGRHEDALAAFAAILDQRADDVAALKGMALAHSARGDFTAALGCWEAAADIARDDLDSQLGRARTLLKLTRNDEAQTRFRELARQHPEHANVLTGLLEAASNRNDHAGVAEAAQRLWARTRQPFVAQRLVTALVLCGRSDEADDFIRGVEADGGQRKLALSLRRLRLRTACQWNDLAALLHTYRNQTPRDEDALADEIDCLLILGRTEALRELLDNSPPRAKSLTKANVLLALAQAYGRSRVRQTLLPRMRMRQLWKLPGSTLACAVAAAEREDQAALTLALRRTEEAPRRCKERLLPLMAPLAAALHDSLQGLRGFGPWPPREPALELRVRQVLNKAGRKGTGDARLLSFAARFDALRAAHQPLHIHVSCSISDALDVADHIVRAMRLREPLSVVRLGDGEGSFLPCPEAFAHHRLDDQAHLFRTWWSQSATPHDIAFLEQALEEAVKHADIVGVPDLEQLIRQVKNLSDERLAQAEPRMMRGYVSALEHVLGMAEASPGDRTLTSSHFHEAFITWRLWTPVLQRAGSCSLITCHSALAAHLERSFGIRVRHTHLLPPEAKWSNAFAETGSGRHYPDRFNELRDTLDVLPGELHLVAAGVLGKIYCQWIKAAGGVAVDIGSVADYWCGYRTRYSISALQSIMPVAEADYLQLAAKDARIARIFGVEPPPGGAGGHQTPDESSVG